MKNNLHQVMKLTPELPGISDYQSSCLSLAPCRALSSDYSIELLCDKTLKRPGFHQLVWEKRNLFLRQTNPYPA